MEEENITLLTTRTNNLTPEDIIIPTTIPDSSNNQQTTTLDSSNNHPTITPDSSNNQSLPQPPPIPQPIRGLENAQFIRINYDINTNDNHETIINTIRTNIMNNFNNRINNLFINRNIDEILIDNIRNSILSSIDLTHTIINETENSRNNYQEDNDPEEEEVEEDEEDEDAVELEVEIDDDEEVLNQYINNVYTPNQNDDINDINSYIDNINIINNINNETYYTEEFDNEYINNNNRTILNNNIANASINDNNPNVSINDNNQDGEGNGDADQHQDIIDLRNSDDFLNHDHNNNLYFTNYLNIVRNNVINRNESTIIYNIETLLLLRDSNTELNDAVEYEMLLNLTNMVGKVDVGIKDIDKAAPIIELEEVDDICVICQDNFQKPIRKTLCNHLYCSGCLEEWFKKNNKCPICMIRLNDLIN